MANPELFGANNPDQAYSDMAYEHPLVMDVLVVGPGQLPDFDEMEPTAEELSGIEGGLDDDNWTAEVIVSVPEPPPEDYYKSEKVETRASAAARRQQEELDEDKGYTNWRRLANCRGVDTDLFFPERGASSRAAKEICRACVVREDCLDANIGEKFGIFGGLTERERRHIRRTRIIQRRPSRYN
jgi:WhiB family redox-sensing transcriptional regulator